MNIEAIFFDIDNTLYRPDFIPTSAILALNILQKKNILTAIATGRSQNRLPQPVMDLIASYHHFPLIIASNGQHTTYQGQTITSYPIPVDDLNKLRDAFDLAGWACLYYDDIHLILSGKIPMPEVGNHLQQEPGFIISSNYHLQNPIYQICAFCPQEEDEKLLQILKNTPYQRVRNNQWSADIYPKVGGKNRGIRDACDKLNIDLTKTVAFGDGRNDVCMFDTVGIAIAMGDGNPALKARANFITTTVEDDGILKGLQLLGVMQHES